MTAVKIQGTWKKDERELNGLEAIAETLISEPTTRHMVVAEIEATSYEVNLRDGGSRIPKVRIVSVEPLDGDEAAHARKMRDEAYHARTGQTAPPPTLFDDTADDAAGAPVVDAEAVDANGDPWPGDAEHPASETPPASGRGRKR